MNGPLWETVAWDEAYATQLVQRIAIEGGWLYQVASPLGPKGEPSAPYWHPPVFVPSATTPESSGDIPWSLIVPLLMGFLATKATKPSTSEPRARRRRKRRRRAPAEVLS